MYKLEQRDGEGRAASFDAHLLKLKDYYFLDLYLVKAGGAEELNAWAVYCMVPAHLFLKVQVGPTLQMAAMDPEWLKKYLEKNPNGIGHQQAGADKSIVLTASTRDLQRFVLKNARQQGLFGAPSSLGRKARSPQPR